MPSSPHHRTPIPTRARRPAFPAQTPTTAWSRSRVVRERTSAPSHSARCAKNSNIPFRGGRIDRALAPEVASRARRGGWMVERLRQCVGALSPREPQPGRETFDHGTDPVRSKRVFERDAGGDECWCRTEATRRARAPRRVRGKNGRRARGGLALHFFSRGRTPYAPIGLWIDASRVGTQRSGPRAATGPGTRHRSGNASDATKGRRWGAPRSGRTATKKLLHATQTAGKEFCCAGSRDRQGAARVGGASRGAEYRPGRRCCGRAAIGPVAPTFASGWIWACESGRNLFPNPALRGMVPRSARLLRSSWRARARGPFESPSPPPSPRSAWRVEEGRGGGDRRAHAQPSRGGGGARARSQPPREGCSTTA